MRKFLIALILLLTIIIIHPLDIHASEKHRVNLSFHYIKSKHNNSFDYQANDAQISDGFSFVFENAY